MLQVSEGTRTSCFDRYRKGPVKISGPAFNEAVGRYRELKAFGMHELDFTGIPPVRFKGIARHAGIISMPAGQTTLAAHQYLAGLLDSRKQLLDEAPLAIVSKPWKRLVFDSERRVTKRGYTLCFLDKLQDSLRRRDVYVENSDRWGDPRAKLLQDPVWRANRICSCLRSSNAGCGAGVRQGI